MKDMKEINYAELKEVVKDLNGTDGFKGTPVQFIAVTKSNLLKGFMKKVEDFGDDQIKMSKLVIEFYNNLIQDEQKQTAPKEKDNTIPKETTKAKKESQPKISKSIKTCVVHAFVGRVIGNDLEVDKSQFTKDLHNKFDFKDSTLAHIATDSKVWIEVIKELGLKLK